MAVEWDRRVIPIWRNSNLSSTLPETKPINSIVDSSKQTNFDESILQELLSSWQFDKTIGGAADLLNFAHIDSFKKLLYEPASFLSIEANNLPLPLNSLVNSILNPGHVQISKEKIFDDFDIFRAEASVIKKRLASNPQNSVALIDLARLYAAQGQKEKAKLSVLKALYLNPNHRFILRSGARFLVHIGETEKAAFFINKAQSLPSDPWLLATHIALETILDRMPKYLKKSADIIKAANLPPMHMTELASSLATFEAFKGDFKGAKRNFNKALIAPNDNAIAQALWAAKKFSIHIAVDDNLLLSPFTHEARYYQYVFNAEFESALSEAKAWFVDEPYAGRPLKAATYISSVLGDYVSAERLALLALKVDKHDVELQNNLVFSLVAQNKLAEAMPIFEELVKYEKTLFGFNRGHTLANWGMIQFRLSNYDEGEKFYKLSISQFEKDGNFFSKTQAAAFMARESLISKNPNSGRLLNEVLEILKKFPSKIASKILESSKALSVNILPVNQKITQSWHYDYDKNVLLIDRAINLVVKK